MAHKPTRGHDSPKEPVMIPVSEVGLIAKAHGDPVWGATSASDLPDGPEEIERILPGERTVVVLASPHSRSAIASPKIQVAQYDTIPSFFFLSCFEIGEILSKENVCLFDIPVDNSRGPY